METIARLPLFRARALWGLALALAAGAALAVPGLSALAVSGPQVIAFGGPAHLLPLEDAAPPQGWTAASPEAVFGNGASAFGAAATDGEIVLASAHHMTLDYAQSYALAQCRAQALQPDGCRVFLLLVPQAAASRAAAVEFRALPGAALELIHGAGPGSDMILAASSLGAVAVSRGTDDAAQALARCAVANGDLMARLPD